MPSPRFQILGPRAWLSEVSSQKGEQAAKPLIDQVETWRQAAIQGAQGQEQPGVQTPGAPTIPPGGFTASIPSYADYRNQAQQALLAAQKQSQQQQAQAQATVQASAAPAPRVQQQPFGVQAPAMPVIPQGGFAASIGKLEDWTGKQAEAQAQPAAQTTSTTIPSTSSGSRQPAAQSTSEPTQPASRPSSQATIPPMTGQPGELEAWTRQEATRLGIDPDIAVRVAMSEGGLTDPVRQSDVVNARGERESSYGPFQLLVGGGLGDTALQRGIDPRNPAHAKAAITFALEHASQDGWGNFHGAARVGVEPRTGIGTPAPQHPTPPSSSPQGIADGPDWRKTWGRNLTPNQIDETLALGLDWDSAVATCSVAGAVAFARAVGRNPTFGEALDLARNMGLWNKDVGAVRGSPGQIDLLKRLGVNASIVPLDERNISAEIAAGRPIQVNAHGNGGHFFILSDYDPNTRQFYAGNSGSILKSSKGRQWFTLPELSQLGVGVATEAIALSSDQTQ